MSRATAKVDVFVQFQPKEGKWLAMAECGTDFVGLVEAKDLGPVLLKLADHIEEYVKG